MARQTMWFAVGLLAGLMIAPLVGASLRSAGAAPAMAEGSSRFDLESFLARLRAAPREEKTGPVFSKTVLDEARSRWGELGTALTGKLTVQDKDLILALVVQSGPEARSVLRQVCLCASDNVTPELVGKAIRSISSDRDTAMSELLALSRNAAIEERARFAWILLFMGLPAEDLYPALNSLMKDADGKVRVTAADVLMSRMQQYEDALRPLGPTVMKAALGDLDEQVRVSVQQALIRGGIHSGEMLDILATQLKSAPIDDEYMDVVFNMASRFPVSALSRVDGMLASDVPRVRTWGVRLAIRALPHTRLGLLPKLRKASQDPDEKVRAEAQKSLKVLEEGP